jgi:hypothetical protein
MFRRSLVLVLALLIAAPFCHAGYIAVVGTGTSLTYPETTGVFALLDSNLNPVFLGNSGSTGGGVAFGAANDLYISFPGGSIMDFSVPDGNAIAALSISGLPFGDLSFSPVPSFPYPTPGLLAYEVAGSDPSSGVGFAIADLTASGVFSGGPVDGLAMTPTGLYYAFQSTIPGGQMESEIRFYSFVGPSYTSFVGFVGKIFSDLDFANGMLYAVDGQTAEYLTFAPDLQSYATHLLPVIPMGITAGDGGSYYFTSGSTVYHYDSNDNPLGSYTMSLDDYSLQLSDLDYSSGTPEPGTCIGAFLGIALLAVKRSRR